MHPPPRFSTHRHSGSQVMGKQSQGYIAGGGAAFQWQPRRKVETSGRNVNLAPGVCRALMYTIIYNYITTTCTYCYSLLMLRSQFLMKRGSLRNA